MRIFLIIFVILVLSLGLKTASDENFLASLLARGKYLLNLINKQNTVGYFEPNDLAELSWLGAPGKYIRGVALVDLTDLIISAKRSGAGLKIISAYRGYDIQKALYSRYGSIYGEYASRISAEAGHSEHQLGTAIDFGAGNSDIDLTESFAKTKQGQWLKENAWKFGFALSYPGGKEQITGYKYEPWHYRFIGRKAAKEWHDSGLTLGEFLSLKKQYYKEED